LCSKPDSLRISATVSLSGVGSSAIAEDRTVLVWGAMGFLGQHMVPRLLQSGLPVAVLSRPRHLYPVPPWASEVQWFELHGDSRDQATLESAAVSAGVIYDFAGSSGAVSSNREPISSLDANCRSQLEFLMACEKAGHVPHIVFASTWLAYDVTGEKPIREEHQLGPKSIYAAHKICIEYYLQILSRARKVTCTICRISNPCGFDNSRFAGTYKVMNAFVQQAVAGRPIRLFGDGSQLRDFIYIQDLIDGLLRCGFAAEARNEIFNLSSGRSHTMRLAAELICELVPGSSIVFAPWPPEYLSVEPGDYRADIAKARTQLGFAPAYSLESGLEETIRKYQRAAPAEEAKHPAGIAAQAGSAGAA
jgi:UDP-glucose 4-epimerase